MPTWLRKFTFHEINDYYTKQSEEMKKSQSKMKGQKNLLDSSGRLKGLKSKLPSKTSYK